MPYLLKTERKTLQPALEELHAECARVDEKDFAGFLNYSVFYLVKRRIKERGKQKKNYWFYALIMGTMICNVFEIYRRLIVPYEDRKIASEIEGEVDV